MVWKAEVFDIATGKKIDRDYLNNHAISMWCVFSGKFQEEKQEYFSVILTPVKKTR